MKASNQKKSVYLFQCCFYRAHRTLLSDIFYAESNELTNNANKKNIILSKMKLGHNRVHAITILGFYDLCVYFFFNLMNDDDATSK